MSCIARTARRRRQQAKISKVYKPKYQPEGAKNKPTGKAKK